MQQQDVYFPSTHKTFNNNPGTTIQLLAEIPKIYSFNMPENTLWGTHALLLPVEKSRDIPRCLSIQGPTTLAFCANAHLSLSLFCCLSISPCNV